MNAQPAILVLNAGSSSIKFGLFDCGAGEPPRRAISAGEVAGIGTATTTLTIDGQPSRRLSAPVADGPPPNVPPDPYRAALAPIVAWIADELPQVRLTAVAHRVVHGGLHYSAPVVVDERVLQELRTLIPLAPLHQPHNIDAIEVMQRGPAPASRRSPYSIRRFTAPCRATSNCCRYPMPGSTRACAVMAFTAFLTST